MTELNNLTNVKPDLYLKITRKIFKIIRNALYLILQNLELAIISKNYIEKINSNIRKITNMNQWQNTQTVITWFKSIENKESSSFITFDIVDFYPSITKELLTKSMNYAKSLTTIEEEVKATIFHARKSLLFDKTNVWVKKDNTDFDVTMGSYDGADVCELVGLYLLNLLTNKFGKHNICLYRDDDLSCFQNISGPDSEKMCKIFTKNRLIITVESYLPITNFLDVTIDLKSGTYYPYRKQNNETLCIHKQSNHPPSTIK